MASSESERLRSLWALRNMQQDRAVDAERRGFPGTAATAREQVEALERQISEAEAAQGGVPWTPAHP